MPDIGKGIKDVCGMENSVSILTIGPMYASRKYEGDSDIDIRLFGDGHGGHVKKKTPLKVILYPINEWTKNVILRAT